MKAVDRPPKPAKQKLVLPPRKRHDKGPGHSLRAAGGNRGVSK